MLSHEGALNRDITPLCNTALRHGAGQTPAGSTRRPCVAHARQKRQRPLQQRPYRGISEVAPSRPPHQTRLNTSVPLVPPKPKLFLTAMSSLASRAVFAQ